MHSGAKVLVALGMLLLITGCSSSQPHPQPEISAEPDNQELIVADQTKIIIATLEQSGVFLEDDTARTLFDSIVARLALPPSRGKPKVRLLRNPRLNAFALYDGTIGINTGVLAKLTHPDQLAFVLAHELAHWLSSHPVLQYNQVTNSLLMATVLDGILTPLSSRLFLDKLAEKGIGFLTNASVSGYGRQLEREADEYSLNLLEKGGFDTRRALDIFEIFGAPIDSSSTNTNSTLLLTHPEAAERRETVVTFLAKASKAYDGAVAIDPQFVYATAHLRLLNARMHRRAGNYIESLDDLAILQRAVQKLDTTTGIALLLETGLTYHDMLRDFERFKASVPPETWQFTYGDTTDVEIKRGWQTRATESLQQVMGDLNQEMIARRALAELAESAHTIEQSNQPVNSR